MWCSMFEGLYRDDVVDLSSRDLGLKVRPNLFGGTELKSLRRVVEESLQVLAVRAGVTPGGAFRKGRLNGRGRIRGQDARKVQ